MTTAFETEPCSRCGGTGRFSHNGEHDRCYKCDGKNGCRAYTKRGRAAKDYYLAKFRIPASEVKVGDVIATDWIKRLTVQEVREGKPLQWKKYAADPWQFLPQIDIVGLKTTLTVAPGNIVRRLPTPEENEAAIADALAYQATLTKAGTPRKK